MNSKILAFLAVFAVACGKKKEPETPAGPMIEASVGQVDVNRRPNAEGMDQRWMNAPVSIKNNLAGPITVNKIDWKFNVSTQDIGSNSKEFNEQIPAGGSGNFLLTNSFTWKDETPLLDSKLHVTGTITWTGPKGNVNTTPLDVTGNIKDEPAANILDKDGAGDAGETTTPTETPAPQ